MSPAPANPGGMDTYEKLVESVADWIGRNDLAQRIPDFIHLAEVDLSRISNLRVQEKSTDGVLVADQDWIPLPDDIQVPRQLKINSTNIVLVNIVSIDSFPSISQAYTSGVDPMAGCMIGERMYLSPAPGVANTYTLYYWARLMPLSSSNSTNRILKDAPDALLYGALTHSAPYIGDDARIQLWGTLYAQFKDDYRRLEWRSRTGGGPLRIRPDISVDDRHNYGGG
jgi:hypothetical protein